MVALASGASTPAPAGDVAEAAAAKPMPEPAPKPKMPAAASKSASAKEEQLVTFEDHLQPIFEENCTVCHDSVDQKGGLDLTSYRGVIQGGGSGHTLVAGDPDASRLYMLVSHKAKPTMPPDEPPIPGDQIEAIRKWIAQGAPENSKQAKAFAAERAAEAAKMAEASASAAGEAHEAVMPERLPRVERVLPARPGALRAIAVSPSAPLLAIPGQGQILLWHADRLEELGVLEFPFGMADVLRFSADGSKLLAAGGVPGKNGGAVLYDVRTGIDLGRYGETSDAVLAAALSPDAERIAVGGTHRRVDVFLVDGGERAFRIEHDDWVLACDFSPDGELLASADRSGKVLVTQARTGRDVYTLTGHSGAVNAVRFSPKSDVVASAGADGTVRAWRMSDGRPTWNQRGHGDEALCLAWEQPGGLVSGGADGALRAWTASGGKDGDLPAIGEWIYGVAFTRDGARLFAADWQGRLTEVDMDTRKVLRTVTPLAIVE